MLPPKAKGTIRYIAPRGSYTLEVCQKNLVCCYQPYIPSLLNGGFDCDRHPIGIEKAIDYACKHYRADGDTPATGRTQVWQLASELLPLIKKDLDGLKIEFQ